jgi:hypothetical protein
MTRRQWIALGMASGSGLACRKNAQPTAESTGAAVHTGDIVHPLGDHWQHVMGGELTRPEPGVLRLQWGESLSAAKWTGEALRLDFDIELEARRLDGTDFFCGLTFPARPSGECLTWIVGGWGGSLVGISSIDDRDASANETTRHMAFEKDRWYCLRLARIGERIKAFIDNTLVVNLDTTGKKLSLRPGPIDICAPFGLATWQSTAEFRSLRRHEICG